jgi:nitrite reductase/ring-hydroxylating ferredoxin subunit
MPMRIERNWAVMVSKVLRDCRGFESNLTRMPRGGTIGPALHGCSGKGTFARACRRPATFERRLRKSAKMPELFVAKVTEFADGDRRIVTHEGLEIGVFHWQGNFYAYENLCLHQGGPCCEGVIMHKVEDVLGPDKTWRGQTFSAEEAHFVCPWHGYEYDIKTGKCAGNRRLRLRAFELVRRGGDLYVMTGTS